MAKRRLPRRKSSRTLQHDASRRLGPEAREKRELLAGDIEGAPRLIGVHPDAGEIFSEDRLLIENKINAFGPPEIMNTDQGSQFTSFGWTDRLRRSGVRISMDGKGRFLDNIFVERLWRSLEYECVCLHAWETGSEAKAGVGKWIGFHNR